LKRGEEGGWSAGVAITAKERREDEVSEGEEGILKHRDHRDHGEERGERGEGKERRAFYLEEEEWEKVRSWWSG